MAEVEGTWGAEGAEAPGSSNPGTYSRLDDKPSTGGICIQAGVGLSGTAGRVEKAVGTAAWDRTAGASSAGRLAGTRSPGTAGPASWFEGCMQVRKMDRRLWHRRLPRRSR